MTRKRFSDIGVDPKSVAAEAQTGRMKARYKRAAVFLEWAEKALADFDRGAHIFGLNKGQFSMIDLATAVLKKTGPAEVSVWTWVIAEYEVKAVSAFIESGQITDFRMVIDWAGAQRDMPYVSELQSKFGPGCIRVTKTHAKIVTVSTPDGWRVVIRGSLNLNKNPRFEQFDVSDDPAIYEVIRGLEAEFWRRGKPLPVRELAHADAADLLDTDQEIPGPGWAPKGKAWF